MRPNFAQDAPPTSVVVGGASYPVETDYRTWIRAIGLMRALIPQPASREQALQNVDTLSELQMAVFGGILADEKPEDVLSALLEFASGYPEAPTSGSGRQVAPAYSFEYDLNAIIVAIRNQSGIDLSYRRVEPFHWWEFLLEFSTLCGEHYILRLMEIRGYEGKDPAMLRQKARYALPREDEGEVRAAIEEINGEFYNA